MSLPNFIVRRIKGIPASVIEFVMNVIPPPPKTKVPVFQFDWAVLPPKLVKRILTTAEQYSWHVVPPGFGRREYVDANQFNWDVKPAGIAQRIRGFESFETNWVMLTPSVPEYIFYNIVYALPRPSCSTSEDFNSVYTVNFDVPSYTWSIRDIPANSGTVIQKANNVIFQNMFFEGDSSPIWTISPTGNFLIYERTSSAPRLNEYDENAENFLRSFRHMRVAIGDNIFGSLFHATDATKIKIFNSSGDELISGTSTNTMMAMRYGDTSVFVVCDYYGSNEKIYINGVDKTSLFSGLLPNLATSAIIYQGKIIIGGTKKLLIYDPAQDTVTTKDFSQYAYDKVGLLVDGTTSWAVYINPTLAYKQCEMLKLDENLDPVFEDGEPVRQWFSMATIGDISGVYVNSIMPGAKYWFIIPRSGSCVAPRIYNDDAFIW